jgi:hypothetical protein
MQASGSGISSTGSNGTNEKTLRSLKNSANNPDERTNKETGQSKITRFL